MSFWIGDWINDHFLNGAIMTTRTISLGGRGATAIELGLIAGLVGVLLVSAVAFTGDGVKNAICSAADGVSKANATCGSAAMQSACTLRTSAAAAAMRPVYSGVGSSCAMKFSSTILPAASSDACAYWARGTWNASTSTCANDATQAQTYCGKAGGTWGGDSCTFSQASQVRCFTVGGTYDPASGACAFDTTVPTAMLVPSTACTATGNAAWGGTIGAGMTMNGGGTWDAATSSCVWPN